MSGRSFNRVKLDGRELQLLHVVTSKLISHKPSHRNPQLSRQHSTAAPLCNKLLLTSIPITLLCQLEAHFPGAMAQDLNPSPLSVSLSQSPALIKVQTNSKKANTSQSKYEEGLNYSMNHRSATDLGAREPSAHCSILSIGWKDGDGKGREAMHNWWAS